MNTKNEPCKVVNDEVIVRQRIFSPFKHYMDVYDTSNVNRNELEDKYNFNMNNYNTTKKTKQNLEQRKLLNIRGLKKVAHMSTKFLNMKGIVGFPLIRLYKNKKLTPWSARGKLKLSWSKMRSHRYKMKCNDTVYRVSQIKPGMVKDMIKNGMGMDAFGMSFDIFKLKENIRNKNQNENSDDYERVCRIKTMKVVSLPNVITRLVLTKSNKRLPVTIKRISRPLKTTMADAFRSKFYIKNNSDIPTEVLLYATYIFTNIESQGFSKLLSMKI